MSRDIDDLRHPEWTDTKRCPWCGSDDPAVLIGTCLSVQAQGMVAHTFHDTTPSEYGLDDARMEEVVEYLSKQVASRKEHGERTGWAYTAISFPAEVCEDLLAYITSLHEEVERLRGTAQALRESRDLSRSKKWKAELDFGNTIATLRSQLEAADALAEVTDKAFRGLGYDGYKNDRAWEALATYRRLREGVE